MTQHPGSSRPDQPPFGQGGAGQHPPYGENPRPVGPEFPRQGGQPTPAGGPQPPYGGGERRPYGGQQGPYGQGGFVPVGPPTSLPFPPSGGRPPQAEHESYHGGGPPYRVPQRSTRAAATKVQEFRRTCRACGTVWHSLVSREKQVKTSGCLDSCMMCGSSTSNPSAQAQYSRNVDASGTELHRLRTCPRCGSSAYDEQVVEH